MKLYFRKRVKNYLYKLLAINSVISTKVMKAVVTKRKRNSQIYCVGLPRSGTHSLAHLFSRHFRSRHEPLAGPTVKFCMSVAYKNVSESEIENVLTMRDIFLNLEVEAAHYLYMLVPYLADLFPDAKFILTVREPRSWLNSEINMNLKTAGDGFWDKYQQFKYGKYSYSYDSDYKDLLYICCHKNLVNGKIFQKIMKCIIKRS